MKKQFSLIAVLVFVLMGACTPDALSNPGSIGKSKPAADHRPTSIDSSIPDLSTGEEMTREGEPEMQEPEHPIIPTLRAEPASGKGYGARGSVYPDGFDVVDWDSEPGQKALNITGMLPTPCHQLRYDVAEPDLENRIEIDLYSVSDPERICAQVLVPFEVNIPLGELPAGEYTIWVNGKLAGELHPSK